MKRDLDVVRGILMRCEKAPSGEWLRPEDFGKLTIPRRMLGEHVAMMMDRRLIDGKMITDDSNFDFAIFRILWEGHDFLALAKSATRWRRFLAFAKRQTAALTVEFFMAWARSEVSRQTGIPLQ